MSAISKRISNIVDISIVATATLGVAVHQFATTSRLDKVKETVQMYR